MVRVFSRRVLGIAYLTSRWIVRQPLWMFQAFIYIIGFLIMMFAWGGLYAIKNITLVFIIIGFWSQGLNIIAQNIGWGKIMKLEEMIIGSPIGLLEFYLGVVLGSLFFSLVDVIPAIILLYVVDLLYILPYLLVLGVLAMFLGSFIGLIVVLRIKNPTNISALTNPLVSLTTLLPPVYYPASLLPHNIGTTLSLIPTATLMEIARWLGGLPSSLNISYAFLNIGLWFVVVLLLLSRIIRWGLG